MKKIMLILVSVMMAAALAACTPTTEKDQKRTPPTGAEQQTTVDGAAEKLNVDTTPSVTVCIYSVKDDKSGLKQNMDGIETSELTAELLLDKMIELGVVETGIKVLSFEQKDQALIMDLSGLEKADDMQIQTAIANTFLQNFDAMDGELRLSVNGKTVSDKGLAYDKQYKELK